MKEFIPVGDTFGRISSNGVYTEYKVIEGIACNGCAFQVFGTGCAVAPACNHSQREDALPVIFIEVKEINQ